MKKDWNIPSIESVTLPPLSIITTSPAPLTYEASGIRIAQYNETTTVCGDSWETGNNNQQSGGSQAPFRN